MHDELLYLIDPRRDRWRWKLLGEGRRHPSSPLRRGRSDHRSISIADRRRNNEGDERLVLAVQNSGLDLTELRLKNVLNSLCLDAVPAHLELRVDSAEKVHALRLDVDLTFVPGAVEAAELRVRNELLGGLLRQVAVSARHVHPSDAELSDLPVRKRAKLPGLEDDISDVGERRADGDGLPRPQALATGVGARLCRAVRIDDLPSAAGPGLHERAGKGFARRHDVAAQWIREIHLRGWCEGGEKHRRTEQHCDFSFAEDSEKVRAGANLLLCKQDHSASRYPGAVHLGNAAVVSHR